MTNSISQSVPSVTTSVPNVFATIKGYPLAKRFLSCPAAAKLLKSERFIKPLYIDSKNILGAHTEVPMQSSDYIPLSATISIPEKTLLTTKGLRSLSFEIFNAQKTSYSLYQEADLGNIGMDSFAKQKEERELADTREHFALMKKCRNHWKIPPEELRQLKEFARFENEQPEMHLFNQEIFCHTDSYRQEWIQLGFQEIYCKKHPGAKRS